MYFKYFKSKKFKIQMQFNKLNKILSTANFSFRYNFILSLINSILEVLSLGSLIPLIIVLVDKESVSPFTKKLNNFFL